MWYAILVRDKIVCSLALPKSVNFILCKNSCLGYTLIVLWLQDKLENPLD